MKNILTICQARYGSTRLPGKVLLKIRDDPLLLYVIRRLKQIKTPNKIIIATASSNENHLIIDFAEKHKISYFIGDENDVLDRYYQTAKQFNGDIIVRITSDCPLVDPAIIDRGLSIFLKGKYDYVSNVDPPTYPDGFDVEIFSFETLEKAWLEARLKSEREHVTPYIRNNKEIFSQLNYKNHENLENIRLTVDTKEDFELISILIDNFYDKWEVFSMDDIIEFLDRNPELLKINSQYERNEGYLKSLKEDKKI